MNEQGNQAASRCTSDEAMIERLSAAYDACFTTRGKNKGKLRKTAPKWRTDAHVMWNALQFEFFPHRMQSFSIQHHMSNAMLDPEFHVLCQQFAREAYEQASA
jgi:hypothetical protein